MNTRQVLDHGFVTLRNIAGPTRRPDAAYDADDTDVANSARMSLSLNHYTHWLWKQDLRNMMHFLALRTHSHAQVEAQAYANAIVELLEPQIPGLMGLHKELMS